MWMLLFRLKRRDRLDLRGRFLPGTLASAWWPNCVAVSRASSSRWSWRTRRCSCPPCIRTAWSWSGPRSCAESAWRSSRSPCCKACRGKVGWQAPCDSSERGAVSKIGPWTLARIQDRGGPTVWRDFWGGGETWSCCRGRRRRRCRKSSRCDGSSCASTDTPEIETQSFVRRQQHLSHLSKLNFKFGE